MLPGQPDGFAKVLVKFGPSQVGCHCILPSPHGHLGRQLTGSMRLGVPGPLVDSPPASLSCSFSNLACLRCTISLHPLSEHSPRSSPLVSTCPAFWPGSHLPFPPPNPSRLAWLTGVPTTMRSAVGMPMNFDSLSHSTTAPEYISHNCAPYAKQNPSYIGRTS